MEIFKSIRILSILLCCVFVLTSCGERYSVLDIYNDENTDDKTTLRFMSQWTGTDVMGRLLETVLAQFMQENPDIIVINESMSGQDFLMKLKVDFASGNEPDVFGIWPGANILSLISAEKIADLTQTLEQDLEWKNSFDRSTWYYVTSNGRIYGIPFEIIYQNMFINRDIFDKYNVKIPKNFTELKNAVTELRRYDIIPIAYNAQLDGGLLFQNIIASLGGRMESRRPFKGNSVNEIFLKASDYLKELYDLGAFPNDAFNINKHEMNELFLDKRAAMIVQRSEFIGEITNRNVKSVDMIPFPYIETGRADPTSLIYGLGSGTFYVSRTAWNDNMKHQAAVRLLKFITSEEVTNLFVEETKMLPAVRGDYPMAYYSGLMLRGREIIDKVKEFIEPPVNFFDKSIWDDIIIKGLPYVLEDAKSAEELWQEALHAHRKTVD